MAEKKNELAISEPRMVKSHDVKVDVEYFEWKAEIKHRCRSAEVKAVVKVNGEKLLFNWQLGRDLVQKKAEERWGTGVLEQVSLDMQRELPHENGFSALNLRYMKQWYLFYTIEATKLQRPVAELHEEKLQQSIGEMVTFQTRQRYLLRETDILLVFLANPKRMIIFAISKQ